MEEENQQLDDTTKNSTESAQQLTAASGEVSTNQITEGPPILETPKEEEGSEEMTPQEDLSPTDPIRVSCRCNLLSFRMLILMEMELRCNKVRQETILVAGQHKNMVCF